MAQSHCKRGRPRSFLQFEANCFRQDGNVWTSIAVSHQQGFSNWAGLQRMNPLCSDTAGSNTMYSALQTVMHNNFIVLNWTWKQPKAMRRGYEKSVLSALAKGVLEWRLWDRRIKDQAPWTQHIVSFLSMIPIRGENSKWDVNLFKWIPLLKSLLVALVRLSQLPDSLLSAGP